MGRSTGAEPVRLRRIVDGLIEGFQVIDTDWRYVYLNDAAVRHSRKARDDLLGVRMQDAYPGIEESAMFAVLRRCMESREPAHLEHEFVYPDGERSWFELSVNPVPEGIAVLSLDIGPLKEAEERLRRLNQELEDRIARRTEQLEAVNQELEAFTYSVSHDLRAPLRSMSGFSDILLEDHGERLDEAGRDAARRIRAASQRMAGMIDDLLRLSRISRRDLSRETVDLSGMARRIAADLRDEDPERSVDFRIAGGLEARTDPKLLELALRNLLENAWKYSRDQEEAVIEVGLAGERSDPPGADGRGARAGTDGGNVRDGAIDGNARGGPAGRIFVVRDNGVGFDPVYADRLFTPFQRLHGAEDFPGTGVGLAIVHRVVHRHGGRIWAESRPGEGAAFFFTLDGGGPKPASSTDDRRPG